MDQSLENRIRERAYEIWAAHGYVHGQAAQHPRSLSLPVWTHAPCGCVGARENRAASWIDERGPLPRS
jgi:hypothetical protein